MWRDIIFGHFSDFAFCDVISYPHPHAPVDKILCSSTLGQAPGDDPFETRNQIISSSLTWFS